jgi:hypothetical protein
MSARKDQTVPYWDAKNEETLAQIPPPQGTSLEEKSYWGADYGRGLIVGYNIGELSIEEVSKYYDQRLQSSNWTREYVDFDSDWFFALYRGLAQSIHWLRFSRPVRNQSGSSWLENVTSPATGYVFS